jgi:hypothetical protein
MAWQARVLVIANVTASSPDLIEALKQRAEQGPVELTLLMPATNIGFAGREECEAKIADALGHWREAGLEGKGIVGDPDPVVAVHETWDPRAFDEVIVSTLPGQTSKWLRSDLPRRVEQITGLSVKHVTSRERKAPHYGPPPPPREKPALGPLTLRAPHQAN